MTEPPASGLSTSPAAQAAPAMDLRMVLWMLLLTAIWGLNAVSVKMLVQDMAPMMGLTLRSVVGLVPLTLYGLWRGESFRFRGRPAVHLAITGLLFAVEFAAIYCGALYTTGGHVSIFLNTAPFFTALGAHFLLTGDRLHTVKVAGLALAFAGVVALFGEDLLVQREGYWRGDLLVLGGALAWAVATLYIKRVLVDDYTGFQLLYVPVLISIPIFWGISTLTEPEPFFNVTWTTLGIVAFQALVVMNFSYLSFLAMLRIYPASSMHSWVFLAPVWGVIGGAVLLGERLTPYLLLGIALVGGGLWLVNRPRKVTP